MDGSLHSSQDTVILDLDQDSVISQNFAGSKSIYSQNTEDATPLYSDSTEGQKQIMSSSGFVLNPSRDIKFGSIQKLGSVLEPPDLLQNVSPSSAVHSDESNQSAPSDCSSVESQKADSHRMAAIPEHVKRSQLSSAESSSSVNQEIADDNVVSETQGPSSANEQVQERVDDHMEGVQEDNSRVLLNNIGATCSAAKPDCVDHCSQDSEIKIPTIEDLYMKDTKVLNTNVLADEFLNGEDITMDSEKYHKVFSVLPLLA